MRQLAAGLETLYKKNIIHRDLKPQNLLLHKDRRGVMTLKLADFGFARFVDNQQELLATICGSPLYMAPEVLHNEKYSRKSDLWSVGVILFEMLTGCQPFGGKSQVELYNNQRSTQFVVPPDVKVSDSLHDLLGRLLEFDSENRITWEDFFRHQWLQRRRPSQPRFLIASVGDSSVAGSRAPPTVTAAPALPTANQLLTDTPPSVANASALQNDSIVNGGAPVSPNSDSFELIGGADPAQQPPTLQQQQSPASTPLQSPSTRAPSRSPPPAASAALIQSVVQVRALLESAEWYILAGSGGTAALALLSRAVQLARRSSAYAAQDCTAADASKCAELQALCGECLARAQTVVDPIGETTRHSETVCVEQVVFRRALELAEDGCVQSRLGQYECSKETLEQCKALLEVVFTAVHELDDRAAEDLSVILPYFNYIGQVLAHVKAHLATQCL
eukprot:TRINITY_DN12385_c1_g1_i5.p1 TRINITY_DN12385_c1_g1~~TRINITY_DN12385_c1_g1_i5.p1  ORF type:complete len:448 (+),score=105.94 TRINITY_DN12385_c1_g1_i5:437-1780(+)